MTKIPMLPIHLRDLSVAVFAIFFTIWTIIDTTNGNLKIMGWDKKVHPPDSMLARLAIIFLIIFICYGCYVVGDLLRKKRILYIHGSRKKKLLTTDGSESNTISAIPQHELGKCCVAIRWIPAKLDVAKIKAFGIYKSGRFRPHAKFQVSIGDDKADVVGEIKQYVSTSETFRSDRWGRDTIEFSPPENGDTFDLKIQVTSQYYKEGDPQQEKQPPPDYEEYEIWIWWGLTIREWLQLKRAQEKR